MVLSIQEKFKIDFQDGNCGSHLGFSIGTILAIFDLQVNPMILTKFWISNQKNFTFFSYQIFPVNGPSYSGEVKNRFSRW